MSNSDVPAPGASGGNPGPTTAAQTATAPQAPLASPTAVRAFTATAAATQRVPPHARVPEGLQVAAGYGWRLIVVAAAVYLTFAAAARLTFVAVAVFVGLVITALLRPVVDQATRVMPRGLAVPTALILTLALIAGIFTFIGNSVATQSQSLGAQFADGLADIERSLAHSPLHLRAVDLTRLGEQARTWITSNGGSLAGHALGGAGVAIELLTGLLLAIFCSIFFLSSGDRIWAWLLGQTTGDGRRWDIAARAGWSTFAGYTRGVVLIAATNAVLVCVTLLVLRVPLALPLALLVFFAAFVPLIGSPVALAVATLVALAARGPLIALLVLALIVVIGQLEAHVLHPLVMSRAVRLHPLVVALTVACGTVLAGVVGAVIAVPLVAVTWSMWNAWRARPEPAEAQTATPHTADAAEADAAAAAADSGQ
ncbi:AI-2E family transporter [Oryzihumus sp.]|uniref:AI-2E family transporter n=1 Tax=Oryzihumus sp. TaxID=1968903 RepID=UPI002ED87870